MYTKGIFVIIVQNYKHAKYTHQIASENNNNPNARAIRDMSACVGLFDNLIQNARLGDFIMAKQDKLIKLVLSSNNVEYQLHVVSLGRGDKRVVLGFVPVKHDLLADLGLDDFENSNEFSSARAIQTRLQAQLAIDYQSRVRARFTQSDKWTAAVKMQYIGKLDAEVLVACTGDIEKMTAEAKALWDERTTVEAPKETPKKIWWSVCDGNVEGPDEYPTTKVEEDE